MNLHLCCSAPDISVDLSGEALCEVAHLYQLHNQREKASRTNVVVVGVDGLVHSGQSLVCGAAGGDVVGASQSVGELVEDSSATDVTGSHCGARAQPGGSDLVDEDAAEVDLSYSNVSAASISSRDKNSCWWWR